MNNQTIKKDEYITPNQAMELIRLVLTINNVPGYGATLKYQTNGQIIISAWNIKMDNIVHRSVGTFNEYKACRNRLLGLLNGTN